MIKEIAIGVGSIAAIGVVAYVTRKWWMPLISNSNSGKEDAPKPSPIKKEAINKLSYEYIVKCVKEVMLNGKIEEDGVNNATLWVLPNKKANEYYDFAKSQGQSFFVNKLTDEEKTKMVVAIITTSDNMKDIIWGRVYIPNELSEDFHDFIPSDKVFKKSIELV